MPQKSSQYLNKAINVLSQAVFVYDENMQIKYFNSAAEKITGHRITLWRKMQAFNIEV